MSAVAHDTLAAVTLSIENTYADGYKETTQVQATIPCPPADLEPTTVESQDILSEWEMDNLFPHTGVGRDGDAWHTVTITAATDPSLVGYVAEFGG